MKLSENLRRPEPRPTVAVHPLTEDDYACASTDSTYARACSVTRCTLSLLPCAVSKERYFLKKKRIFLEDSLRLIARSNRRRVESTSPASNAATTCTQDTRNAGEHKAFEHYNRSPAPARTS